MELNKIKVQVDINRYDYEGDKKYTKHSKCTSIEIDEAELLDMIKLKYISEYPVAENETVSFYIEGVEVS